MDQAKLFGSKWHQTINLLADGLNDAFAVKRLLDGAEHYRLLVVGRIEQGEMTTQAAAHLNKAILPVWTQVVHRRWLPYVKAETIIDEMIEFANAKGVANEETFKYGQPAADSKDPEADAMEQFAEDFRQNIQQKFWKIQF